MSIPRRSLDNLFASARSERSPLQSSHTEEIVASSPPTSATRRKLMSPAILATTAISLIAAAGITVKVIHDNDKKTDNNIAVVERPVDPSYAAITPPEPPANQPTIIGVAPDVPPGNTFDNPTIIVRKVTADDGTTTTIITQSVRVIALKADKAIFASLGLEQDAMENICTGLESADMMRNCSDGSYESQVKVCMVKDGASDEVVLMDRRGPMPVMFTSSDGRGHVVQSKNNVGVDPNKLVPVAAEGCGENVLMWFQPTKEFVSAMPGSLGEDLNETLQFQVRIEEGADGIVFVTTTSKDGEVLTEVIRNANNDGKEIRPNSACRQPATKAELEAMMNLDFLKPNNANAAVLVMSTQKNIDIDSLLRASKISKRCVILTSKHNKFVVDNADEIPSNSLQETRLSQGAINSPSVYPNPTVNGDATMQFNLLASRVVSMNLLNLNGETVKELAHNVSYTSGPHQISFGTFGVPAGMYLVTVSTDQGEQIVSRLIVQ